MTGIATDGSALYVADACGLRQVDLSTGATATYAGSSTSSHGVTVAGDGDLYTTLNARTDLGTDGEIVRTDPATGTSSVFASPNFGCHGTKVYAVASDSSALYVEAKDIDCSDNSRGGYILRVDLGTAAMSQLYSDRNLNMDGLTMAGSDLYADDDVSACEGNACIQGFSGELFSGPRIIQIATADGTMTPVAGAGSGYRNGTGTDAWFASIGVMSADGTDLYVPDTGNNRLREVSSGPPLPSAQPGWMNTGRAFNLGEVRTISGNGSGVTSPGDLATAGYNQPEGLTTDNGSVYVGNADSISRIHESNGAVSVPVGAPADPGYVEAPTGADSRVSAINSMVNDGLTCTG